MSLLRLLLLSFVFIGLGLSCVIDDDCGGPDQAGICVSGICQCGIGYVGDLLIDPTACSLSCSPAAVPDSVVFLEEPLIGLTAAQGNFILNVTLDPYSKQVPTTIALLNPTTGTPCGLMPARLGSGAWSQEIVGDCDSLLSYSNVFASEVAQGCWNTLAPSVESGPDYEITFNEYETQVEVIQSGLAPFGQVASRSSSSSVRADETTITREFRRDYTIRVATQFKPSSAPFLVIAGGRIRYRLVTIDYDLLGNVIRVVVETETAIEAKLSTVVVNFESSNGISAVVTAPVDVECDGSSPAGFCSQFHTIEFSDDPCAVAAAELVLDATFQCADGSDASTCGFTNLPLNNVYSLSNLILTYDSCPVVTEFGIDTANSFLRLHEDVVRSVVVSAPALQNDILYGRCSIEPTNGASFQSVTMSALKVFQVASPSNIDLGDQLSSSFLTLISNAIQTSSGASAVWDFDLLIDPAFFSITETYFLEATLELTFANTGPLTKRLVIPLKNKKARTMMLVSTTRDEENGGSSLEDGVRSSTFRTRADATQEEEEVVSSGSAGVVMGIAGACVGIALIAGIIVVVVVVKKRRKKQEEENMSTEGDASSDTSDSINKLADINMV